MVILATAVLASGCESPPKDPPADQTSQQGEFSGGEGIGDGGSMSGTETSGAKVSDLDTVYFDFDRATIRDDQKPALRQNASAMRATRAWRQVVVEGHTDERGSEEYNLALGERRANSVKQYLIDSGVQSGRIDTVSFGESKPAVQGHDESAWRWNRRAEFRVIR